ncbi:MAG: hypothetical protein HXY43_05115 [Fischerella sp.]|jgi:hypothetical protein|uniref:hypothetical protein n=1 Tax=Fischerella sp. TaxID=1191 RepID=UPI00180AFE2B|nr:hypothetical protein [Fischerella sp.]NWF58695.1 hypothetical protein [Fischerella sp.]
MAQIQTSSDRQFAYDTEIWNSLKCAIAASSGFQRWLLERDVQFQKLSLEQQVQHYLRETLENLAY